MRAHGTNQLPADRHVLFGAELSYYSAKARAYLRWKAVDFEERPADMHFYQGICQPRIGRQMIPVVITPDDQTIQDTTLLLDHFEAQNDRPSLSVPGGFQGFVDSLLELYADDWLPIPAMHYRWNYDAEATMLEIGMLYVPGASKTEQLERGRTVSSGFRGALPHLGISSDSIPSIEASWEAVLVDLDAHFRSYPFLFGHRPAKADFALVGALYAHQYRDAFAGTLMRNKALAVAHYVERMMYPNPFSSGVYLEDDQIPDTLMPLLRRMMSEQVPYLASVAAQLDAWKSDNIGDESVPTDLGFSKAVVEGCTIERVIQPYSTWLLRRALDRYQGLEGAARQAADEFLQTVGGESFQQIEIRYPLVYDDRTLTWM